MYNTQSSIPGRYMLKNKLFFAIATVHTVTISEYYNGETVHLYDIIK